MKRSHCDDIAGLIPEYALEALSSAEQALVEEHVARCAECRTLLTEHQALSEGLLYTSPPVAAPPHLEADLRRRLAEARAKAAVPRSSSFRDWLDRLFSPAARPALALTVLVFLSLGASNLYWLWTTNQLRTQQAILAEELEHAERDEEMLYDAMRLVATGGRSVILRGDAPAPQAAGTLTLAPDRPEAFLVADGLPPLPPGKTYQLWFLHDGQRESGGLFILEPDGEGVTVVRLARPLADYQAVEVTVEPAGGSPGPTGPRVMGGPVP